MNKDDQEKRWMAYMDGQMSASEALDFEHTLDARDRARLDQEVRLESTISDCFGDGPCCPVQLWNDLADKIAQPASAKAGRIVYWASRTVVVLAATAAIVISAPYFEGAFSEGSGAAATDGIAIQETSRAEFSTGVVAVSYEEAEKYLHENNINIHLAHYTDEMSGHRHAPEFLGVCRGRCPEGTLYELRFWCCNKPLKILIARRGTAGEKMLKGAVSCGDASEAEAEDEYVTAFVGEHSSSALRHVLRPVRGNIV